MSERDEWIEAMLNACDTHKSYTFRQWMEMALAAVEPIIRRRALEEAKKLAEAWGNARQEDAKRCYAAGDDADAEFIEHAGNAAFTLAGHFETLIRALATPEPTERGGT